MQDLERELHHLKFLNSNMIRELEAADLYDKIRGRGTGQARAFFSMSVMKTYLEILCYAAYDLSLIIHFCDVK